MRSSAAPLRLRRPRAQGLCRRLGAARLSVDLLLQEWTL